MRKDRWKYERSGNIYWRQHVRKNRYLKDIGRIGCVRRQISRNVQQFVPFAKLHDVQRSSLCCIPKEFCNKHIRKLSEKSLSLKEGIIISNSVINILFSNIREHPILRLNEFNETSRESKKFYTYVWRDNRIIEI